MRASEAATACPPWLEPSAALSRFVPSDADVAVGRVIEVENKRYGARLGAVGVLLPEDKVSEVLDRPSIFPLPNTAAWFEGLINLRGNLVPVFDLRELLETRADAAAPQMVLVLDKGDNALGLAIDGLPVAAACEETASPLPRLPGVLEPFVRRAYPDGDDTWLDVDLPGLADSLSKEMAA